VNDFINTHKIIATMVKMKNVVPMVGMKNVPCIVWRVAWVVETQDIASLLNIPFNVLVQRNILF